MPIQQVTSTVALEPNQVYVIPPNANLDSIDTHLRLSDLEERRGERAPIDHFFRSLAGTRDGTAIGVVLTGAGTDGALGLRWIKEQGGLTVAQDPIEAEFDGMPRTAISTGLVDIVAPLRDIPQHVMGYCATEPRLSAPTDRELVAQIVAEVRLRTGQDCSMYRRSVLLRRLRHRMQVLQLETLDAYLELLRQSSPEAQTLLNALHYTVGEFFHEPDIFDHLEQRLLPSLFDRISGSGGSIRAWSMGCSTGEVAYSLAILMLEQAAAREVRPRLQVFATDQSDDLLRLARSSTYPHEVASTISRSRLERFFVEYPDSYRLRTEVRDIVVFTAHDIFKDPPFSHLDLILCPNLLGDLQPEVRHGVLELFRFALEPHGVLVVGPFDEVDEPDLFEQVDETRRVYRRKGTPGRGAFRPLSVAASISEPVRQLPSNFSSDDKENAFAAVYRRAMERHSTPSVLLDGNDVIVHYSARAWTFLRIPGGELTHDIEKLVLEPLRLPLHTALRETRRLGRPWVSEPIAILTDHGPQRVLLRVERVMEAASSSMLLVMFDELADDATGSDADRSYHDLDAVSRLGAALQRTSLRLRSVVEPTSPAAKGQSASTTGENEQLRGIHNELESALEEMRAVNEELIRVDLRKRRRMDELAQRSADLYQLLHSTGIATLFLDSELKLLRFTPVASEIFSLTDEDVGRHLGELVHDLAYNELVEDANRVLEHLTLIEREVHTEKENRWYLLRMLPYQPVPEYISGLAISLVDITDRRRAEETLRVAGQRKDEFLALLAHELRNPLAPISSGIELLQLSGNDPDIVHKVTSMMRRQVRLLVRMVDDLLEVSRISGGRLRLRRFPVLVSDIVRDATAAVAPLMEQAQQHLGVNVGGSPLLVEADAARLTQVLSNLLNNASRYTPSGGHITVEAGREGDEAVIRVIDTGVGLSADVIPNIFDMFYRGKAADQVSESGLGIGLAIAKDLVEMHGGTLTARSDGPGRGSQFTVRVPLSPVTAAPQPRKKSLVHTNGHRVLVVDDNQDAAETLSLQVKAMGTTEVCTTLSGAHALRVGPEFRPDVVLLDLGMPEMDGFEVARRIRLESWGQHVHLVALTGFGQEEDQHRTKDAGFDRHLTKPADYDDIESVLAEHRAGSSRA